MNYTFFLQAADIALEIQVYPQSGYELGLDMSFDEDYDFGRKMINKSIVLIKGKDDGYEALKELQDSNTFVNIYFIIKKAGVEYWRGVFNVIDCNITIQAGAKAEFKPVLFDEYTTILREKDKEVNVLDGIEYADKNVIGNARSELKFKIFINPYESTLPSELDPNYFFIKQEPFIFSESESFVVGIYAQERIKYLPNSEDRSNWNYNEDLEYFYRNWNISFPTLKIYFYTEYSSATIDWIPPQNIDNSGNPVSFDLYKYIEQSIYYFELSSSWFKVAYYGRYERPGFNDFDYFQKYQNVFKTFIPLKTFIAKLVSGLDSSIPGVKSTFMFNDESENGINYGVNNYVSGESNFLNNLFVSDLYDYYKKKATQNSSELLVQLTNFFDELNTLFWFTLVWFIDKNNFFRIEHIDYFENNTNINLRTINGGRYVLADKNYEIDKKKLYNRISIKNENAVIEDFRSMNILFDLPLVNGERENVLLGSLNNLYIDLTWIDYSELNNKRGFVIVHAADNGTNYMIDEDATGVFNTTDEINNSKLTLVNLFNNFGKKRRPLTTCELISILDKKIEYTDLTVTRYKKQIKLNFVVEEDIDWRTLFITNFNDSFGKINSYSEQFANGKKEIELLY